MRSVSCDEDKARASVVAFGGVYIGLVIYACLSIVLSVSVYKVAFELEPLSRLMLSRP